MLKRHTTNPKKIPLIYTTLICLATITFLICLLAHQVHVNSKSSIRQFPHEYGVFLSEDANDISEFSDYQTIVIDAANFTAADIAKLQNDGHTVYSYLNIGSIEDFRPYYPEFEATTLSSYDNWDGEYWINTADSSWQDFITKTLVPAYLEKGITNFFIDNCDVYYQYETDEIYNGITDMLLSIKEQTADNNGQTIINGGDTYVQRFLSENHSLNKIADGVNQETVFSSIDFSNDTFSAASSDDTDYYLSYLKQVSDTGANIYLLEYCTDTSLGKDIIRKSNHLGYTLYIASSLDL